MKFILSLFQIVAALTAATAYRLLAASPFGAAPVALGANTLAAGLILDTLSKRSKTTLGNVFAPIRAFASDVSEDPLTQGQRVQVSLASAGATAQTNPTNWESGDTTVDNIGVTVGQYSVSFHITPLQQNNNFRLNQLIDINLQSFVNKVQDVMYSPFAGVNFANFIEAQATFSSTNMKSLFATIAKSPVKNLILDATAYSQLLPGSLTTEIGPKAGLAGFDNIFLNTRWTGAGTNVYGFAGGAQSVAYVVGTPMLDDETKTDINATILSIDVGGGMSVPVMASTWLSRATRTRWASWDIMLGASKLDNSGGKMLKSGGTA
jgi:hypothetical protein